MPPGPTGLLPGIAGVKTAIPELTLTPAEPKVPGADAPEPAEALVPGPLCALADAEPLTLPELLPEIRSDAAVLAEALVSASALLDATRSEAEKLPTVSTAATPAPAARADATTPAMIFPCRVERSLVNSSTIGALPLGAVNLPL